MLACIIVLLLLSKAKPDPDFEPKLHTISSNVTSRLAHMHVSHLTYSPHPYLIEVTQGFAQCAWLSPRSSVSSDASCLAQRAVSHQEMSADVVFAPLLSPSIRSPYRPLSRRLLLPYVPEGSYMLAAQDNAPKRSSTHDMTATNDQLYEMVGELRDGRSTLSEGQNLLGQRVSGSPGTLPASCRSSTTRGGASNPSSRRVSGRKNSVIILSR